VQERKYTNLEERKYNWNEMDKHSIKCESCYVVAVNVKYRLLCYKSFFQELFFTLHIWVKKLSSFWAV